MATTKSVCFLESIVCLLRLPDDESIEPPNLIIPLPHQTLSAFNSLKSVTPTPQDPP